MTAIRVLSTIGMRLVLEEIAPEFERAHGCTIERHYDSSVAHMRRIAEGKTGDAAVFTAAAIDDLISMTVFSGGVFRSAPPIAHGFIAALAAPAHAALIRRNGMEPA
jgi:ABC-type molybdate transport system substrate-binding protein